MHLCGLAHVCRGQRTSLGIISQELCSLFYNMGSSAALSSSVSPDWVTLHPRDSLVSFPMLEIQVHAHSWLFPSFTESTLLTEPSPKPN